ncbi:MAG: hypothetical protein L6R35_002612, partial [Caloplaca aegaea]
DHFLKNPSTVEGGKVTLLVTNSKSGKTYPFVIPFHSFDTNEAHKVHQASRIAVIGVKGVNSLNTDNDLVTLEAKDILCQCFRDKDGTYPLGIPFGVAPEKGGPRYSIPNLEQTMSIVCSDALWLYGHLRTISKAPAIPRRSISSQLFANLSFALTEDHTDAQQVLVPLTGDPVLGKWSASSVDMASVVDANGNDVDGKGGLCQVLLEGDDVPLDMKCFKDKSGTQPLGTLFSVATEKGGGPGYSIPSAKSIKSVFCSDAPGLWKHLAPGFYFLHPNNNNNNNIMHHHHFFLFSLFLTFALPSFAQRAITLGISLTLSGPPKHLIVVPFNDRAERDPSNKPNSSPKFFYIPEHIHSPNADRESYITIRGVKDVEGTLEVGDIACQCFRDKEGKQILGSLFTAEVEGRLIPDTDLIESIFCSDMKGMWDHLVKPLVPSGSSNSVEPQPTIPDMAFEAITSTLRISPNGLNPPPLIGVKFHSLDSSKSLHSASADGVFYITVADVENVVGNNHDHKPITLNANDIVCQCFKDKDGTQPLGTPFTAQYQTDGPGQLIQDNKPIESIFCSDVRGLFYYLTDENNKVELSGSSKELFDTLISL